jgi:hypothetical protein
MDRLSDAPAIRCWPIGSCWSRIDGESVLFGWAVTYAVHMLNVCCCGTAQRLVLPLISSSSKATRLYYNADRLPVCPAEFGNLKLGDR